MLQRFAPGDRVWTSHGLIGFLCQRILLQLQLSPARHNLAGLFTEAPRAMVACVCVVHWLLLIRVALLCDPRLHE